MGSYYQPGNYLKSTRGGASYYQPKNYLSGGMKLEIDTKNYKLKSRLSKSKISAIKKRIDDFDYDKDKKEQYDEVESILSMVNEDDFDNEFQQKEIRTLKHLITKQKGSKPSEFLNILERVLDNVSSKNGGSRRLKKHTGGFYPSVMGGVINAGKLLMVASLRQGYRMLTSKNSIQSKKSKMTRKNRTKKLR
jgi:hypothetical protein